MMEKIKKIICKIFKIKQCKCNLKKTNKFLNEGI